jgi:hypothetical protein
MNILDSHLLLLTWQVIIPQVLARRALAFLCCLFDKSPNQLTNIQATPSLTLQSNILF